MSLRVPIAAATMSFGVLAEAVRELLQAEFEHGVGRGLWEGDKRETALVKCVVNISVKMGLILKATDFGIRYTFGDLGFFAFTRNTRIQIVQIGWYISTHCHDFQRLQH